MITDLTQSDFLSCGHINDKVYQIPNPVNMPELIMITREACEEVSSALLSEAGVNVFCRANNCLPNVEITWNC